MDKLETIRSSNTNTNASSNQDNKIKKLEFLGELGKYNYKPDSEYTILTEYKGIDKEVYLPDIFYRIESEAFKGNSAIRKVVLNKGLREIGRGSFESSFLKEIEFNKGLKVISSSAFANTKLDSVKTNEGLIKIGARAFGNCENLKEVELNEGLLIIENGAFIDTAITKIILPKSLMYIGLETFGSSIEDIYILGENISLEDIYLATFHLKTKKTINIHMQKNYGLLQSVKYLFDVNKVEDKVLYKEFLSINFDIEQ